MHEALDAEERGILEEFLTHGRAVRAERARAAAHRRTARFRPAGAGLGRGDAGLSQAAAGRPGLPVEPRGSGEGARGRHRLRRRAGPGRSPSRPLRPRRGDGVHHPRRRRRYPRRAAGAHGARRRRHGPQRHLREGASGQLRARRQGPLLQGLRRRAGRRRRVHPRARSERLLHLVRPRRPLRQLLRRQPPALQRQRGQGHGLGQARLSQGGRALRRGAGGAGSGGAAGARPRLAGAGGPARRPAAGAGRAGDRG